MLALLITLLLYVYWTFLGVGVLAALGFSRHWMRNVLLAPAAGASVTLLATFELNRLGMPVHDFGAWLGAALLALGVALFVIWRPRFPWRGCVPFGILLIAAAALTLRPMREFGFNWISYGNEDMTNYVLAAQRLFHHGYWDKPDPAVYTAGTDRALGLWFLHVEQGMRSGSELLLAWLHSVAGHSDLELFMPLIGTLHLVLISAAAALVYRTAARRRAALLTVLLMAGSSLTTLGTLAQLIAQVWGIALAAATAAILIRPVDLLQGARRIRYGALGGLMLAALIVSYSEILPFLAVPVCAFAIVRVRARGWKPALAYSAIALALCATLLGTYARHAAGYIVMQFLHGTNRVSDTDFLFPFYLVPSGLANFWGLAPINLSWHEPWLSLTVLCGGVLLVVSVAVAAKQAGNLEPAALMAATMFLVGARLFFSRTDFSLFKLAMYVQPFLLGMICVGLSRLRRGTGSAAAVVLLAMGLPAQYIYVERSSGELGRGGGGLAELPGASDSGMIADLNAIARERADAPVLSDTESTIMAKLDAEIFRTHRLTFPSDPSVATFSGDFPQGYLDAFARMHFDPAGTENRRYANFLRQSLRATYTKEFFWRPDGRSQDEFAMPKQADDAENSEIVLTGKRYSMLNRSSPATHDNGAPAFQGDAAALRNHVVLVASKLSKPASWFIPSEVSLSEPEEDLAFPDSTMEGLGRYALFQILDAAPSGYLALSLTSTYAGDGISRLPEGQILGAEAARIPFEGRGSARVIVPMQPRRIRGRSYFALDMISPPIRFPNRRTGLMALYGRDVPLDSRQLSGFARDISYLSREEFEALVPPRSVSHFPQDLANPALQYSGIYEDGWVAENCDFRLAQQESGEFRIAGEIPQRPGDPPANQIRVLEDGHPILERDLTAGPFDITAQTPVEPGAHRIEIQFRSATKLSAADPRPAAAHLSRIGFGPFDAVDDIGAEGITFGTGWYDLEHYRGETFRWARSRSLVHLKPRGNQHWLAADLEPNSGGIPVEIRVSTTDGKVLSQRRLKGREKIRIPFVTAADVEFAVDEQSLKPAPGDPRQLGLRFFRLRLE